MFDGLFHQLLQNAHKSFCESIAPWMVWAASDVVNLIELKELLEFPGTVAWSIAAFLSMNGHPNSGENHTKSPLSWHVWNCLEVS